MICDMIDQIIDFNKSFVEQKGYEKYLTDKYPDKKLAVLSCMDTRLTRRPGDFCFRFCYA